MHGYKPSLHIYVYLCFITSFSGMALLLLYYHGTETNTWNKENIILFAHE